MAQLQAALVEELTEVLCWVAPQLGDDLRPTGADLAAQILQNRCLCLLVHHDLAPRRKERKALLGLLDEPLSRVTGERAVAVCKLELGAMEADKVQDGEHRLVPSAAQAASELLHEDG